MSKLRRSMLFLPGANAAMLSTAFIYRPDSIMFDLEDAVALREKDTARMLVFHALQHPMYQDAEYAVWPAGSGGRRAGRGGRDPPAENRHP